MPTAKDVAEKLGVWSKCDQVEELRAKYHLKKKDCDSYIDNTEAQIRRNEQIIASMRQENWDKRVELAMHENGDNRVINTVFRDDRVERLLSLQRCTAAGAIEEMDQKVCETEKFLNAMRFEREKGEKKLQELTEELERMQQLEQMSPEQQEALQTVTMLENALDKALIKYETARIISGNYQNILERLKEESMTLPAKLDAMEQALVQQQAELKELKVMSKQAMQSRDNAKLQMSKVEQEAYEARRTRDALLTTTRKEVEASLEDSAEKVDKRAGRATLIIDSQDPKTTKEQMKRMEMQRKLIQYEDIFRRVKEAARVTDIEDVIEHMRSQKTTSKRLKDQVHDLQDFRNRLRENVRRLVQQYHDMKYTGEQKLSRGEAQLEEVNEGVQKEVSNMYRTTDRLEKNKKTLQDIETGIITLLEKLSDVKLRPPEHNYTRGDVFDQLSLARKKLDQLVRQLGGKSTDPEVKDHLNTLEFQDFLETRLPADNVRIQIESSTTKADYDYDLDNESEQVLTRTEIKRISQMMIEAKQKPRRKRVVKKK